MSDLFDEGTAVQPDSSEPGDFLGEYLESEAAVTEQHVYHHSAAKEPYGNLTMGKSAKGDRTFSIEIKSVTADNLGVALALQASLHSLAVLPDPEPEPEETVDKGGDYFATAK